VKRLIVFASVLTALSAGIAIATPGSGGVSTELGRRMFDDLTIRSSGDVVVAKNTYEAGGFSGWHSHPGKVVIAVRSGQITIQRVVESSCAVRTYEAGEVFIERPHALYNGINEGSETAVLIATFFNVPVGGEVRIDQPDPGVCEAD
jgi:quercetin dioxygenase-like cupin family protein